MLDNMQTRLLESVTGGNGFIWNIRGRFYRDVDMFRYNYNYIVPGGKDVIVLDEDLRKYFSTKTFFLPATRFFISRDINKALHDSSFNRNYDVAIIINDNPIKKEQLKTIERVLYDFSTYSTLKVVFFTNGLDASLDGSAFIDKTFCWNDWMQDFVVVATGIQYDEDDRIEYLMRDFKEDLEDLKQIIDDMVHEGKT